MRYEHKQFILARKKLYELGAGPKNIVLTTVICISQNFTSSVPRFLIKLLPRMIFQRGGGGADNRRIGLTHD